MPLRRAARTGGAEQVTLGVQHGSPPERRRGVRRMRVTVPGQGLCRHIQYLPFAPLRLTWTFVLENRPHPVDQALLTGSLIRYCIRAWRQTRTHLINRIRRMIAQGARGSHTAANTEPGS